LISHNLLKRSNEQIQNCSRAYLKTTASTVLVNPINQ
jgi:hypothetical protein